MTCPRHHLIATNTEYGQLFCIRCFREAMTQGEVNDVIRRLEGQPRPYDGSVMSGCGGAMDNLQWVRIRSWHVLATYTRVPGCVVTRCGRTVEATPQDTVGTGRTCESCLRLVTRNG